MPRAASLGITTRRSYPNIAYDDFTQQGLKYAAWDGVARTLATVERDLGPIAAAARAICALAWAGRLIQPAAQGALPGCWPCTH